VIRFRSLLLVSAATASFAAAGCATAPNAPVANAAAPAASGGGGSAIRSLTEADARERQAYARTTQWSFPGAESFYRLLSSAQQDVVGARRAVSADVGLAVALANQGRGPEAQAALRRASDRAAELGSPPDVVALVTLGRAIEAGQTAVRQTGAARTAAFTASLAESRRAVQVLDSAPAAQGPAAAGRVDEQGRVVISALDAARINERRRPGEFGGLINQGLNDAQRTAILRGHALHLQGAALAGLDRLAEADAADVAAQAALAEAPPRTATWLRAQVPAHRAEIALRQGDARRAERLYDEALDVIAVTSLTGTRLESALLQGRARTQLARGDRAAAEGSYKASVDVLSRQTDGQLIPRSEVEDYLLLLAPGAAAGEPGKLEEYVRVSSLAVELDTARTMALVAAKFSTGGGPEAEAITNYQKTDQALRRARARVAGVNRPESGATPEEIAFAQTQQVEAELAHESAREAALAQGGRVQAVLNEPVTLKQTQASLRPGEAYVRYLFVDGKLQAWVATPTGGALHTLDMGEAEAAQEVALLRRAFSVQTVDAQGNPLTDEAGAPRRVVPRFNPNRANRLYDKLVGPLAASLGDAKRVIIEPTGDLFSLPFAALVTEEPSAEVQARRQENGADYRGVKWFGAERAIVLSPGTGAFIRLRQAKPSQAPNPLLAFADPQPSVTADTSLARVAEIRRTLIDPGGDRAADLCIMEDQLILGFPRLPDTSEEVAGVARILGADPGRAVVEKAAFTDVAVTSRTDLEQYKIVYFATHGMLPEKQACWPLPILATSMATENSDGVLDAVEIGQLRLDADLVVLSACDTAGAGGEGGPGAGQALGGLAQSFALAGSRGLLVSHWQVDSAATAKLMTSLFQTRAGGTGTADSLIAAQAQLSGELATSHPYYWSAFTLVGDG
jgi:CHAT domain-containing protein